MLVPDADIEQTIRGLFERVDARGIRSLDWSVMRHPERDPGCRAHAVQLLRPYLGSHHRALVVFDRDGCGSDKPREEIQKTVEDELFRNGWRGRAKVIVIEPELEAWLWNGSSLVAEELGWGNDYPGMRRYLASANLWSANARKPPDPKKAVSEARRVAPVRRRARRSPAQFRRLASQVASVALANCQDPAFGELIETLQEWFPETPDT